MYLMMLFEVCKNGVGTFHFKVLVERASSRELVYAMSDCDSVFMKCASHGTGYRLF